MVKKPVVLMILDGWGVAPASEGNGVSLANTPNLDKYISSFPAMTLLASGESVGLSWGEMGNSEVGHLNLGAGKIFYQNLPRINKSIEDESFFENGALVSAMEHVKSNNSNLHIIGLVSEGKVHAMNSHAYALLELAKKEGIKHVYTHAFLDGRDTAEDAGELFIKELEQKIKDIGIGKIASLHGRMYAMDRDNHWERIQKTYDVLVNGKSEEYFKDPIEAIQSSYNQKIYDEQFVPVVIGTENQPTALIKDNDAVVFFNYRADRARQLTQAFVLPEFDKFDRGNKLNNLYFVTMTEYEEGLPVEVAFPKEEVKMTLPKILSQKGYKQLHVAETEKYAHVTFFFSGGHEDPFEGEDRIVVPSPRVASYAEKPDMSAREVTDHLTKEIMNEKHDFIIVNYANPDMVGHTGDVEATIKSLEYVDKYVGEIVDLVLSKNGALVIVADHGNSEELINLQTGEKDKEHSTNPVPCIIIDNELEGKTIDDLTLVENDLSLVHPTGLLSDVAPTVLKLMGIDIPEDMTGRSLI